MLSLGWVVSQSLCFWMFVVVRDASACVRYVYVRIHQYTYMPTYIALAGALVFDALCRGLVHQQPQSGSYARPFGTSLCLIA